MKLTIIKDMGLVHIDGSGFQDLDLSFIPVDVRALQWDNDSGEIEFINNVNKEVNKLPKWAIDAVDLHKTEAKTLLEAEKAELEYLESDEYKKIIKSEEAKFYLSSTDWIVTKIAELQLEGVDIEPLKVKYAAELAERKLMREVV